MGIHLRGEPRPGVDHGARGHRPVAAADALPDEAADIAPRPGHPRKHGEIRAPARDIRFGGRDLGGLHRVGRLLAHLAQIRPLGRPGRPTQGGSCCRSSPHRSSNAPGRSPVLRTHTVSPPSRATPRPGRARASGTTASPAYPEPRPRESDRRRRYTSALIGHHRAEAVDLARLPLLRIGKAYAASPPGLPVGDFLPVALRLFVLGRDSAQLLGQVLYAAVVGISMLDDIPRQIGKSVFPAVARRGAVGRGVPAAEPPEPPAS